MVRVGIEGATFFRDLPKNIADNMGRAYADASMATSQSRHFTTGDILPADTGVARLRHALSAPQTRVVRMIDLEHGGLEVAGLAYRPLDLDSLAEDARRHVQSILQKEGVSSLVDIPLVYKGSFYRQSGFQVEGGPVGQVIGVARQDILASNPHGVAVTAWIGTDNLEAMELAKRYGLQETSFARASSYSPNDTTTVTVDHHLWVGVLKPGEQGATSIKRRPGRPRKNP